MKVLITGASGWLGSELTKQILEKEKDVLVRAFVLEESEELKQLKQKYKEKIEIFLGDICNENDVSNAIKGVKKVFHLAAKVHCHPKNKRDINEFYKINTEASKLIFEKAIEENIDRVIFFSSVSVYGDHKEIITINTFKNPSTHYAKSKLKAEKIGLKLYMEKGLPITIIQPVTVYGGNDIGNFEKLKSFSKKGFLPKFGDGNNKKTVIYFKDLIKLTIDISKEHDFIGKTFICGTQCISINDIIDIFKKDKEFKVIRFNDSVSDLLIKIFSMKIFKPLNKIARQIYVLRSNNEFELNEEYIKESGYTSFSNYYEGK